MKKFNYIICSITTIAFLSFANNFMISGVTSSESLESRLASLDKSLNEIDCEKQDCFNIWNFINEQIYALYPNLKTNQKITIDYTKRFLDDYFYQVLKNSRFLKDFVSKLKRHVYMESAKIYDSDQSSQTMFLKFVDNKLEELLAKVYENE